MPPLTVNTHYAKTHLSALLAKAAAGEEVIIARDGKPMARLVSVDPPRREPRKPGGWKGKIWISPDFDAPDPELESLFYDGPIFPPDEDEKS